MIRLSIRNVAGSEARNDRVLADIKDCVNSALLRAIAGNLVRGSWSRTNRS
jgi:hypothetical protein